jgi:hypothetical protein
MTANISCGKIDIPPTISGGTNAKLAKGIDANNSTNSVPGLAVTLHRSSIQKNRAG